MTDITIFNTNNKHQSNVQYFLFKLMKKLNDKINYLIYILAIIYLKILYKQNTSNHKNHMNLQYDY